MSITDCAQHCILPYFDAREGELLVGGRGVAEIAAQLGQTPYYAYDRAIMARKVAELRAALPAEVELHYAMKANPMPEVVAHLASLVNGLDVASERELRVALGTRTAPEDISFAGPGKSAADLAGAVGAGIVINMESELEMRRIADLARKTGKRPKVAIRVNPDFELKASGMKMGGGPKQFGVDAERVPAMLAELAGLPLEFWGFHLYTGSQNLRAESIIDAQRKCAALAIELAGHAPGPVRMLNLGGGFGIPYFPGDRPLELEPIGANLRELVPRIHDRLPGAQVVIELGR
jgi:diaminopimelate decarboxylase